MVAANDNCPYVILLKTWKRIMQRGNNRKLLKSFYFIGLNFGSNGECKMDGNGLVGHEKIASSSHGFLNMYIKHDYIKHIYIASVCKRILR